MDVEAARRRAATLEHDGSSAEALATLETAASTADELADAISLLVDAVQLAMEVGGPDRAVEVARRAVALGEVAIAGRAGPGSGGEGLFGDARSADALAVEIEREAARTRLGDALSWAGRYDEARAAWQEVSTGARTSDPRLLAEHANALLRLGDPNAHSAAFRALVAARATERLELILDALNLVTVAEIRAGRLKEARSTAEQGLTLVAAGSYEELQVYGLLAWPLALLGDEPACRAAMERAEQGLEQRRITAPGGLARGLLALSLGHAAEAVAAFESKLAEARWGSVAAMTGLRPFGAELVEAYGRAGRVEQGRRALAGMLPVAQGSGQPRLIAPMRRAQGILEGDEDAFRHALDAHAGWDNPFEAARTRLAFGELLRRNRRRAEAREELAAAVAGFSHVGSMLWLERAAAELRLAGERLPARASIGKVGVEPLTRQEGEIIELLRAGLSNREIAESLVLSVKTVEAHLTTIYGKLGVASRTQALSRLAEGVSSEGAPGS